MHYKTISEGEVEWISDKLLYKAVCFKMPKFRSFVYSLIKEVERLVY